MKGASIIVGLALIGCNGSDKNLGVVNRDPEAQITSHTDGAEIPEGTTTLFVGSVSDVDNPSDELLVTWFAGTDIVCPETTPAANGTSECQAELSPDVTTIKISVSDPSNARAEAEISVVVVETEIPVATITSPEADGVYYSDQLVLFEGLLSDAEDDAGDLTAYWTSSIDGTLTADATPNGNGEISGYANLSQGQHIIELHVEDTSGKTNKESVIVTVGAPNTPPSCEFTSPATGSAGRVGSTVTFTGTVSDPDVSPSDLSVEFSSDKDGSMGVVTPNASGNVNFAYNGLSQNTHLVSMIVSDDAGGECVSDILYTVGSAPTITVAAPLDGETYGENSNVAFTATVADNDDPPEQLSLSWESSIDGVFSTTGSDSNGNVQFTNNTLSSGQHSITATVTDTTGLFTSALLSININGAPTQPNVTLSPNPAYTTNNLVAAASGSVDPEGSAVTYSFEWLLNGASTGLTGSTLASSETSKGDSWTVRVTPSDGTTNGPFREETILISNSLPIVTAVSISPNSPNVQDDLTCSYSTSDADGDPVSVSFQWTMGGNTLSSTTDTLNGPFQFNDTLTCTVTPNDGTTSGTPVSASVTVGNTAPVINTLGLSPNAVYTDDIITATATATDGEGDPLTYSWDWYVDNGSGFALVQSNSGSVGSDTLDGVYHFDKDDAVYVVLTVSDGSSTTSQTSSTISILNTPPSAFNVLIDPIAPVAGLDDLTCIAQGNDIDGDSVALSYDWTVDGSSANNTSDTVLSTDIADGEVWACTVTPDDGTDFGTPVTVSVTVGADVPGATGGGFCASAGYAVDPTGVQSISCFSEAGVAGEESSTSTNTWQPGSIYVFSPE